MKKKVMPKTIKQRFFARYRKNRFLFDLLEQTGHDLEGKKFVFIIGCYNSGTTLLSEILCRHPQLSGLNDEGVMLTSDLARPEDFGWRRMWWKCEDKMKMDEGKVARRIKRHWSHFFDTSKDYLLEKSIANTPRATFFERHFAPAYFIHLVRNGYAVTEGIHRKAQVLPSNSLYVESSRYPIEFCASQWRRSIEVVDEQRPSLSNLLEVTYEELTEDTDSTLHKLCSFLEIEPFRRSLKNSAFNVHQNNDIIKNMNEKSISRLTNQEIAAINCTAGDLLKRYHYFIPKQ